jgi:hypothetical protein
MQAGYSTRAPCGFRWVLRVSNSQTALPETIIKIAIPKRRLIISDEKRYLYVK